MSYAEFKQRIEGSLRRRKGGLTWRELREVAELPYERACPEWTRRLEREIGLKRVKGETRALVWTMKV